MMQSHFASYIIPGGNSISIFLMQNLHKERLLQHLLCWQEIPNESLSRALSDIWCHSQLVHSSQKSQLQGFDCAHRQINKSNYPYSCYTFLMCRHRPFEIFQHTYYFFMSQKSLHISSHHFLCNSFLVIPSFIKSFCFLSYSNFYFQLSLMLFAQQFYLCLCYTRMACKFFITLWLLDSKFSLGLL